MYYSKERFRNLNKIEVFLTLNNAFTERIILGKRVLQSVCHNHILGPVKVLRFSFYFF